MVEKRSDQLGDKLAGGEALAMSQPVLDGKKAFKRSEIYELIWQHTARDLAEALGCSDVLLHRACKLWSIPRPTKATRGELMSGGEPRRPDLPATAKGDDPIIFRHDGKRIRMLGPVRPQGRPRPKAPDKLRALLEEFGTPSIRYRSKQAIENEAKVRKAQLAPASEFFVCRIGRWDVAYSLTAQDIGVGRQWLELQLKCEILAPRKFAQRGLALKMLFFRELNDIESRRNPLLDVGGMDIYRVDSNGSVRLPLEVAAPIVEAMSSGRIRFAKLSASPSGGAFRVIKSFDLIGELNEGDLEE
ncbi:MAG: hypothetical protein ABSE69_01730 [Roseiarcus sp.]